MKIQLIDVLIIIAYFAGVIGLGLWIARRKIKGGEDFFLASREMSWPMVGASLFSTNISSQQFVGQAGMAFTLGIVVGMFQMIGAMCFAFLALFFIEAYMGMRLRTSPEFFERRYNRGCGAFVSAINVLSIVSANIAAALYSGATVMTELFGWADGPRANALFWAAVVILGATTGLYTVLGGLRSVIYTDFVQNWILVLGGAVTLIAGVAYLGGVEPLLSLRDAAGVSKWSLWRPWNHTLGWLPLLTGTVILGVHGHCTDHDYVQRALSAKNLYHAKMGCLFASFLKVLALFIITAPGVVAARLFPDLQNGDRAYVRLLTTVMPAGLMGLCLAGLLAAIMSTVSSSLSAASALLTFDFFGRRRAPAGAHTADAGNDAASVTMGRWIIVVVLILCMAWAPSIRWFPGVYSYLINIWALTAPPVFVCVVFGTFYPRSTARGAVATLIAGSILGAAMFVVINFGAAMGLPIQEWKAAGVGAYLFNALNACFIITVICVTVMLVVSHATGASEEDRAKGGVVSRSRRAETMSARERAIYRVTLSTLAALGVIVLILFSPLGIGR